MAEDAFERFRRLRGVAQPVSERGVILTPCPEGTQRYKAPQDVLTAMDVFRELRASGVVCRPMVDHVRIAAAPGQPCPALLRDLLDLVEEYEERAAIAQHCAGLSHDAAEALAWQCLVEQGALEVSTP